MHCSINALGSKYYGTVVTTPYGTINVWLSGRNYGEEPWAYAPSARERAEWPMPSDDNGTEQEIASDMMSGGHYETEVSWLVANAIVKSLASVEVPECPS